VPAVLSSLIDVPREGLSAVLAREAPSRPRLCEWLARIPDPRGPRGRWHPLEFVLALAVCAFTAAGHDSPSAIADWAAGCDQDGLAALGGRRDPLSGLVRPPCERTFRRIFSKADDAAVNDVVHGYLAAMPQAGQDELPEAARREREQRRAAAQARKPPVPGLLPQAAADGKAVRGATRPDGTQVHSPPQPRHRRIAQGRARQHRPRPPLLRPRRPAHPRPLRIHVTRHQEHQAA
jgi:DDE_Tnp_1-associated